jgi:hypothetical protein
VIERTLVQVCTECGVHWYAEGEPPKCTDPAHEHQQFELHRHRSSVALPDGAVVCAVSFGEPDPYERADPPDYGVYLDDRWDPPWPHDHVEWPDFGVPSDATALLGALQALHQRAVVGQSVELGCLGGHGRTGTALACLAVLAGHPAADAVAWVRSAYCEEAVETPEQEAFVIAVAASAARLDGPVP